MYSQTFAQTGQTLLSSELTPEEFQQVMQALVIQIYGFTLTPTQGGPAYEQVRCGYQQDGQPGVDISKDSTTIQAYPQNDPFSRMRDQILSPNDDVSLLNPMSYTQVWRVHFTLYGPNSWNNACLIVSAIFVVALFHDWLVNLCPGSGVQVVQPIYVIADPVRPVRAPELRERRWWPRVDLDLKFNELVQEQITISSGESVEVTIDTDTGITQTFTVTGG